MSTKDRLASIFAAISLESNEDVKRRIPGAMFHISLNAHLPSLLKPEQPTDTDTTKKKEYTEELPPRISFAPSIEQCFYAVYPNVSQLLEEQNYPYLDFYVYVPQITDRVKFIPRDKILANVHDAYMTDEICVATPVSITRVAKVRITATKKEIMYRPFNDKKEKEHFLSPEIIINVLEEYTS